MGKWFKGLFKLALLAALVAAGGIAWWLNAPVVKTSQPVDLSIEPGTTPRGIAKLAVDSGVQTHPLALYWWFRLSGQDRQIKAGSYELENGTTPYTLLNKLVRGEESLRAVTLVEGWNFRQVRAALAKAEALKPEVPALTDEALMVALGKPGTLPEGRFFPDTYAYAKGSSDVAVLKRALRAMDKKLESAWALRKPDSPLKTPEELLVLASIVEKETGQAADRPLIAGVFTNRLKTGMLLQTDPTVIYGLGERFDGNLRKADLLADTPYNTYTRAGLPPGPIAMPGKAALLATVQPANTPALYFVARGDGSSEFSATLADHNRAVNKFQRGQ
ncbi:MAG: endolytic transglycosylase MltG [Pseudomonadota bacterium]